VVVAGKASQQLCDVLDVMHCSILLLLLLLLLLLGGVVWWLLAAAAAAAVSKHELPARQETSACVWFAGTWYDAVAAGTESDAWLAAPHTTTISKHILAIWYNPAPAQDRCTVQQRRHACSPGEHCHLCVHDLAGSIQLLPVALQLLDVSIAASG
jgi:hypothetical protein